MAQTLKTRTIYTGWKRVLLEKPLASTRIFFSIKVLTDLSMGHRSHISFDDPAFYSYYTLDGPMQHFEGKGEGIFQGYMGTKCITCGFNICCNGNIGIIFINTLLPKTNIYWGSVSMFASPFISFQNIVIRIT